MVGKTENLAAVLENPELLKELEKVEDDFAKRHECTAAGGAGAGYAMCIPWDSSASSSSYDCG